MKVLFAIVSCHKNAARRQAQRDTWLPDLKEDYKFFLGNGNSELKEDEVQLDVPDEYEGLPAKVQAIFKWGLEREYTYILKIDDDVYIFPDRILSGDFDKYPYTGRLNKWKTPVHPLSFLSGFAYWVNTVAAQMIIDSPLDPMLTFEDRWVGGILGRAKIEGHNDPMYKVLSLLPKYQWHTAVKQHFKALCQFEPEDLRYIHGLMIGEITAPIPATRPVRGALPVRGVNPRLFRLRRK